MQLQRKDFSLLITGALIAGGALAVATTSLAQQEHQHQEHVCPMHAAQGAIAIPEPIRIEHDQLHEELAQALQAGGKTGEAARDVQQALAGHFEEENRLVMPLLGLLEPLAEQNVRGEMRTAIEMARQVERKLPSFLKEHEAIHEAVNRLERVAEEEGKSDIATFARRLRLHAQHEEVVLYPAAILVGRHLDDQLSAGSDDTAPGASG